MITKMHSGHFDKSPFTWLYGEHEEKTLDNIGYYDESLCINVNNNENKIPIILMEPFSIGTRTKTEVMRERDDSDE